VRNHISLFLFIGFFNICVNAQPFRYIQGDGSDRDSIKKLQIKGYREYQASYSTPNEKQLKSIVEYDKNGNQIRLWILDITTKKQNQWTYKYTGKNKLLEFASYFPDSNTFNQRFIHTYDKNENEIEILTENYNNEKLSSTNKVVNSYDHKGNCIDSKEFNDKGIMYNHNQYVYDQFNHKIEEITYYDNDKVKYRNKINNYGDEDKMPIGFPRGSRERSPEDEDLLKETTTNDSEGNRVTEDGYAIRTFNKKNILLKWIEKNYKIHWFEYTYY